HGPGPVDALGPAPTEHTVTGPGLYARDKLTDVTLIPTPGDGRPATVNKGMSYCKNERPLQDCFFLADVGSVDNVNAARLDGAQPDDVIKISDARAFATTGFGGTPLNKAAGDFGAIYYPWVRAADPVGVGRGHGFQLPQVSLRPDNQALRSPDGVLAQPRGNAGPGHQGHSPPGRRVITRPCRSGDRGAGP